ncbi:hypothetical protein pdam_00005920 [Pocillopora damicornis]|uniref:Uncharacterized protein n=1 Tax=Pocillopora damicornis TaxID=46731 RepID=A0A3M6TB98_POCDA|nr:hypothetical protein pdam_00005920 [Pocillopora damicornis]
MGSSLGETLLDTLRPLEEYKNGVAVLDGFLRSLLSGEKVLTPEFWDALDDDLRLLSVSPCAEDTDNEGGRCSTALMRWICESMTLKPIKSTTNLVHSSTWGNFPMFRNKTNAKQVKQCLLSVDEGLRADKRRE